MAVIAVGHNPANRSPHLKTPLQGKAFVDDRDLELVRPYSWTFAAGSWPYVQTTIRLENGRRHTLGIHRLIMGLAIDDPLEVDHRNGNVIDNQRSNLRVVNRSGNIQNQRARRDGKYSSHRGVSKIVDSNATHPRPHPWIAYFTLNYKRTNLGAFATEIEAAEAARAAREANMPFCTERR